MKHLLLRSDDEIFTGKENAHSLMLAGFYLIIVYLIRLLECVARYLVVRHLAEFF